MKKFTHELIFISIIGDARVAILGSILGVVCAALVSGAVLAAIKFQR